LTQSGGIALAEHMPVFARIDYKTTVGFIASPLGFGGAMTAADRIVQASAPSKNPHFMHIHAVPPH
jgi:hypothetical protein